MIQVNPRSSKPIYEQIVENIKELVVKGVLRKNDPIPSVRKLALMIEVNPNTIGKAYKELERQGIIQTVQGRGTFISSGTTRNINQQQVEDLKDKMKPILIELKYYNMEDIDILDIINDVLMEIQHVAAKK